MLSIATLKRFLPCLFLLLFVGFTSQGFAADVGTLGPGPQNVTIITKMSVLVALGILPFAVMMLTSYVKIIIVLSLLRNAIGIQQTPPSQILNGIALLMTVYVMFPTGVKMYAAGEQFIKEKAPTAVFSDESARFIVDLVGITKEPLREFLVKNTIGTHLDSFFQIAKKSMKELPSYTLDKKDFIVLIPAFITSQLKAAFEIGVLIYLPFFVIDLVTSNILLAMGMMMLSPLTIALPLKLLLLVMVDGWTVIIQGLVRTFHQ